MDTLTVSSIVSDLKVELESKSMLLVEVLAKSGDVPTSRDELLYSLWQDKTVSDDSLTKLVSQTRAKLKAFDDDIIRTIPKKGYLLIGDIQLHSSHTKQLTSFTKARYKSKLAFISLLTIVCIMVLVYFAKPFFVSDKYDQTLVVLPIEAYSESASIVNSAASLTEELTHVFANYPGLFIVSRTQANRFAKSGLPIDEISEKLNARYLVEGSVREQDGEIRLTVQLIDASSGLHVFSRVIQAKKTKFVSENEAILQSISRIIVADIPPGFVRDDVHVDVKLLEKKCDSYIELAVLYSRYILNNIESISQSAESACISYAQAKRGDADAESKIARIYMLMAKSSKKESHKMMPFVKLGYQYLLEAKKSDPHNENIYSIRAKLHLIEIQDGMSSSRSLDLIFSQAKANFNEALSYYPNNIELLNSQGIFYRRLGVSNMRKGISPIEAFEGAELAFKKIILLKTDDSDPLNNLARLNKSMASYLSSVGKSPVKKLEESIKHFKQAIQISPENPSMRMNLANSYSTLGLWLADHDQAFQFAWDAAKESYEIALDLSRGHYKIQNNLADLHVKIASIQLKQGKDVEQTVEKGIAYANQALLVNPSYIWPLFNLMTLNSIGLKQNYANGAVYSKYLEGCVSSGEKGLAIKNNLAEAWYLLIECQQLSVRMMIERGEIKAAETALKQLLVKIENVIIINPQFSGGYLLKGVNHFLMSLLTGKNDYTESLNSLNKAIELNSNTTEFNNPSTLIEVMLYQYKSLIKNKKLAAIWKSKLLKEFNRHQPSRYHLVEFKLQQLIFSRLQGNTTHFQQSLAAFESDNNLVAKKALRQYQPIISFFSVI